MGRPSKFSEALEIEILNRIASGESLRRICQDDHIPDRMTIHRWLCDKDDFATKYARAREAQGDVMDDRILEVANGVLEGLIDPHAAKVAIGAFQWRAMKLAPKKYGDQTKLSLEGGDKPIEIKVSTVRGDMRK